MQQMLSKFNPSQYASVTSKEKYIRVIAGAGSGKTSVLTTRISYLIKECGILPYRILAITFTNKAAEEMRKRVLNQVGEEYSGAFISTYHSFGARFLREEIYALGYPRDFVIVDDEDQERIIKKIIEELNSNISIKPSSLLDYISDCKTRGLSPKMMLESNRDFAGESYKAMVYEEYEKYLKNNHYLDFDDLLIKTVEILEKNEYIRNKWSQRFEYILVDEFQDTNDIQYLLLKLLTGENTNVFVVGDPDQTIYTWRGANVDIIMDFPKDFKPCKDYILDANYRSTQSILNVANKLIVNNKKRIDKQLKTSNLMGAKVIGYQAFSNELEAVWVVERIKELMSKNSQLKYSDFVILYRSNYYSRAFESSLYQSKIPYKIFGGVKFFARKEIKDAVCYLRLLLKDNDNLALERIINVPRRGIGPKTLENIYASAENKSQTPFEYLTNTYDESQDKTALAVFVKTLLKHRKILNGENKPNFGKLLEDLLKDVKYFDYLELEDEKERIENIKELSTYLFNAQVDNPDVSLDEIVQEITLYSAQDEIKDGDYVSLMTVHTAKGLEFPFVFVVGLAENVFPNGRAIGHGMINMDDLSGSMENTEAVEEERRLAYVAFTRAEKQLFVSFSSGYNYVSRGNGLPSRFLTEIESQITPYLKPRYDEYKPIIKTPVVKPKVQPTVGGDRKDYRPGELIVHKTWGEGVILEVGDTSFKIVFKDPKIGLKVISRYFTGISKKGW